MTDRDPNQLPRLWPGTARSVLAQCQSNQSENKVGDRGQQLKVWRRIGRLTCEEQNAFFVRSGVVTRRVAADSNSIRIRERLIQLNQDSVAR